MIRITAVLSLTIITAVIGIYLPTFPALDFFAILLSMIAGLYVGFSFADGRTDKIVIEISFAFVVGAIALFGMWKWLWLIPTGYLLLAIWSGWHHYFYIGARVKAWFAPMCALYCGLLGIFIYVRFFVLN
ncbi:hypothetical protein MNBD_GAMMA21-2623 [hydrothermal vent metagenome]|uniref:Uncharacterized protein n=1 Tax=hydrothermal vent metagenome TaxID=652676 RepID=A0A3B1AI54_9ZZZZ